MVKQLQMEMDQGGNHMPVIESLKIKKFRNLPPGEYLLGKRITIITGQNATGKSTLLGMLAQPFGVDDKDIWGKSLRSKFSEIFKISPEHDKPGGHIYFIHTYECLHSDGNEVQVKTYKRGDSIRFVTGRNRDKGDGNIDIPVIYLGLKRVFPLGETTACNITTHNLSKEEMDFFVEHHRKILIETCSAMTPQTIESKKEKDSLGIATDKYDSYVISAGQDNIGKILGSIISLKRYRDAHRENYHGAFLIIDEADVTLHTASQNNLAGFLIEISRKLDIQIVLTTHSLDLVSSLISYHSSNRQDIKIWHLYAPHGELLFQQDPSIEAIRSSITLLKEEHQSIPKINVYTEDEEAILFLKNLLPKKIKDRVELIPLKAGYNIIRTICLHFDSHAPSIWILDGEQKRKNTDPEVLITMPGEASVEKCMCDFLDSLDDSDSFWKKHGLDYTKQHFVKNRPQQKYDREIYKRWFNNEKKHWGRLMADVYQRWKIDNETAIENFLDEFIVAFNITAKRLGIPTIKK